MEHRRLPAGLSLIFLISLLCAIRQFRIASAAESIIINADGSITPSTANITTFDNITYRLTGNIVNQFLQVERPNVTVDGAGYTLDGAGYGGTGVELWYDAANVVIQNMRIKGFGTGVNIEAGASYATIQGNYLIENHCGIQLSGDSRGLWINGILNNSISTNNGTAIALGYRGGTYIVGNNITGNWVGIAGFRGGFVAYHNNFVNDTMHVSTTFIPATFDDGYPSGGNYWDDYYGTDEKSGPFQNETGSDLIGDTPFVIAGADGGGVSDRYPLMSFYGVPPAYPVPNFNYLPSKPTVGQLVAFDASETRCENGTVTVYRWDFGDGSIGEGVEATHAYNLSQVFKVTLTAISNTGLKILQTRTITVGEALLFGVDWWIWATRIAAPLAIAAIIALRFLRKHLRRKQVHLDSWLGPRQSSCTLGL